MPKGLGILSILLGLLRNSIITSIIATLLTKLELPREGLLQYLVDPLVIVLEGLFFITVSVFCKSI